ncbi:MAG TPA: hypothetical protein VFY93_15470 [Planctomycetota bacterium]|nr:hypothetical protein [Planctomycetota bacterium]
MASRKWLLPLLLSLPLAAVVLFLGGCLPVGAGDPEKSKVDDKLAGTWIEVRDDGTDGDAVVLLPFDGRAYVLRSVKIDRTGDKEVIESEGLYKAWLTTIGDTTFLTAQPLYPREALAGAKVPGLFVAAVKVAEDGANVEAKGVDPGYEALAPLRALPGHMSYEPRAEGAKAPTEDEAKALLQRVLAERGNDPKLYSLTVTYRRVKDPGLMKLLFESVIG